MKKYQFLVEIGTEELSNKYLRIHTETFLEKMKYKLSKENIIYENIYWYATQRRIAIKINDLKINNYNKISYIKHKNNISSINIKNFEYNSVYIEYKDILKSMLYQSVIYSLNALPTSHKMRWGNGTSEISFLRPVHTIILLLNDEIIACKILGVSADRLTKGHRVMGNKDILINHVKDYPNILIEKGWVIADFFLRKKIIKFNVIEIAKQVKGIVDFSNNLLNELTSIVEWPVIYLGKFDKEFLNLPTEILAYTMINQQKCFPIYNENYKIMPYFILIANIQTLYHKNIINGYEKVISFRFKDASFFYEYDRQKKLEEYLPNLKEIIFHKELGSMFEKSNRISELSYYIAKIIGTESDAIDAKRAGLLCKCDHITKMVLEFPDMQGIIGMYYSLYDGEKSTISLAQKEHYKPNFHNDSLPTTIISCSVSIADKIDTLVGIYCFSNYVHKGNKDPFALRRISLGIIRILVEKSISLDLKSLIYESIKIYKILYDDIDNIINKVYKFIIDRLKSWYQLKGYKKDTIQSVLESHTINYDLTDIHLRICAIEYFRTLKQSNVLISINKRITKILSKSIKFDKKINSSLLKEEEEKNIFLLYLTLNRKISQLLKKRMYKDILLKLSILHNPINLFFNKITVMTHYENIRTNRLILLYNIRKLICTVADLSILNNSII